MEKIIKTILFTCACVLAVSCGENSIDRLLEHVENIIVQQPDDALKLLDSVKGKIKSEEQQVRCNLLACIYICANK
jgi:hypothetical protein